MGLRREFGGGVRDEEVVAVGKFLYAIILDFVATKFQTQIIKLCDC